MRRRTRRGPGSLPGRVGTGVAERPAGKAARLSRLSLLPATGAGADSALSETVARECALCRSLEGLAEQEAKALMAADVEALRRLTGQQVWATEQLRHLEEERLRRIAELQHDGGRENPSPAGADGLVGAHLELLFRARRLARLAARELTLLRGAVEVAPVSYTHLTLPTKRIV